MPELVGVDLGTTALKAGLFDLEGNLLATAESSYEISRPRPDRAEQDPEAWLRALDGVLGELGGAPAAIGICSQVNTHVFVDESGAPLRPAIVWQDQRSAEVASELDVPASFLPARAEWVRREEPEVWERTRYVLSPKDFVTLRLCGAAATDPISSFDVVDDSGAYDPAVLALVDGLEQRLPALEQIDAPIGVAPDGAVVVTGTMDAWGNVYGSGLVEHGQAMEVAGTSEILGVLSRERHPTPGVVSFLAVDGLHLHAGPTQAGGAALAWFAATVGRSIAELLELAAQARPGADGLLFLPHLLGERAPLWDSDVRGAFVGLGSDHSLAHLSRAVLEGVGYSARHLLEELEKAGAVETETLQSSGGGSQSDLWCQIKADVLDRSIARVRVRHSGCLGAALMAASGAGLVGSVREAAQEVVRIEREFEPGTARSLYDELYRVYRDIYLALKPTHAVLAGLRKEA